MDAIVAQLVLDVAALNVQIAGMQANVEWLMKLAWLLLVANVGSIILNGLQFVKNNRKR